MLCSLADSKKQRKSMTNGHTLGDSPLDQGKLEEREMINDTRSTAEQRAATHTH